MYLPAIKLTAQIASSLGVGTVINGIVQNNVVAQTTAQKVLVKVGTFVIGSMVGTAAYNHVDKTIDELANGISIKIEKKKTENEVVS